MLMGAPNIVRGGSHSGNISAAGLLDHGVLDILSSDYVPFSLLQSAFVLADAGTLDAAGRDPARGHATLRRQRGSTIAARSRSAGSGPTSFGCGSSRRPAAARGWACGGRGGVSPEPPPEHFRRAEAAPVARRSRGRWSARAGPARTR